MRLLLIITALILNSTAALGSEVFFSVLSIESGAMSFKVSANCVEKVGGATLTRSKVIQLAKGLGYDSCELTDLPIGFTMACNTPDHMRYVWITVTPSRLECRADLAQGIIDASRYNRRAD